MKVDGMASEWVPSAARAVLLVRPSAAMPTLLSSWKPSAPPSSKVTAPLTHARGEPSHSMKPALQLTPQAPAVEQVALPLAGAAHGVHERPQLAGLVLDAQLLPHGCVPGLQLNPHDVPSHVAVAFAGGVQGVQNVPHVEVLSFGAHALPHR